VPVELYALSSNFKTVLGVLRSDKNLLAGALMLLVFVLVAVFANLIATYHPLQTGLTRGLHPPSRGFLMGTDQIGRDVFSWVIYGTRTALVVGVTATAISFVIALAVGLVSGYFGGKADLVLMRIVDILLSIPQFIFMIVMVMLYGSTFTNIVLIIGLLSWPTLARIVRAEVLSLREREFVLAARALGASSRDLILKEILPNALPPVIPAAALTASNAILAEAALSFLGLGDPRVPSWGTMLWIARQAIFAGGWWTLVFPSIFIVLVILSINIIADGLNNVLNPRERT